MDISAGDSTPTSEASYSHTSTPKTNQPQINDGPVLLSSALPRLTSHPATPTNSQLHYTNSLQSSGINSTINTTTSGTMSSTNLIGNSSIVITSTITSASTSNYVSSVSASSTSNIIGSNSTQSVSKLTKIIDGNNMNLSSTTSPSATLTGSTNALPVTTEMLMNSNTPGPPSSSHLPKMLSQNSVNKSIEQIDMNSHKTLDKINHALRQQQQQPQQLQQQQQHQVIGGDTSETNQLININSNNR